MEQQSNNALRLRRMCKDLNIMAEEYRDANLHDEAITIGEAEESVRLLLSLPEADEDDDEPT